MAAAPADALGGGFEHSVTGGALVAPLAVGRWWLGDVLVGSRQGIGLVRHKPV